MENLTDLEWENWIGELIVQNGKIEWKFQTAQGYIKKIIRKKF